MTQTFCDICGEKIDGENKHQFDGFYAVASFLKPCPANEMKIEVRNFKFRIEVESFHFNCSNFHVCRECVVEAISNEMKNQKANSALGVK